MKLLLLFIFICCSQAIDISEEIEAAIGCDVIECKNGGSCVNDERSGYSCTCPPGFIGIYCEKEDTYTTAKRTTDFIGTTEETETGTGCEIKECQNGGFCSSDGRGGHTHWCLCPPGFSGYYCEKEDYEVAKQNCHCENGYCVEENGDLKCVCNPEFGRYDEHKCKACNCGKGANCTFLKGIFVDDVICICPKGYEVKGEKCVVITSTTTDSFTPAEYNTSDSFITSDATITDSFTPTEYNNSDAYTSSEYNLTSSKWLYTSPKYGSKADFETTLDCPCQDGICVIDTYGNIKCVCHPQYAKNNDGICTACNCGQNAECEFVREGRKSRKRCFCPTGYEDRYEYCVDIDECLHAEACPRSAECVNTDGGYECICRKGFRPLNRTSEVKYEGCVEMCNAKTCVNGECKVNGYSSFCKCDNGYTGVHCEQKIDKVNDNRIMDIIEIQSPWIILSGLLLIIFLAFIIIHRNKSVKKNTFIFSNSDDKCPLLEDPKFVNRLQTEILE